MAEQFQPLDGGGFYFRCHPGISCFTECCAKLHLILTPYDILRLKHRLGLSSDTFLERYTDTFTKTGARFPMVKLKMAEDPEGRCPFVTPEGCAVYEDRPGACRLYPVGRAAAAVDGQNGAREKFFIVKEPHCQGFQERTKWTVDEWLRHEGVSEYTAMNDDWLGIVSASKGLGATPHIEQKQQMFFMTSYNLDRFRAFIFESPFLDKFEVAPELKEGLATDDVSLMKFGFQWLKFSLFGEKTLEPKQAP